MSKLKQWVKQRVVRNPLFQVLTGRVEPHFKITYSQCGEDVIMAHVLMSLGIQRPFYVDIGAHHPKYLNNTYYFHRKGAVGVNIEPDPVLLGQFHRRRPKDVNLNIGVTDMPGRSEATLFIFNFPTLNTFSREEAERIAEDPRYWIVKESTIPIVNINDVLDEHCSKQRIDILSVDVEGLDDKIMRALDFSRHKPVIICLETISFSNTGQGVKSQSLIEYIRGFGYMVYADTNINTIFVLEHMWKR
jgi:FkbM family methyltransferase